MESYEDCDDSYGTYNDDSDYGYDGYGEDEGSPVLEKNDTFEIYLQNRNFAYSLINNNILKSSLSDKITTIEKQLLEQDIRVDVGNIWHILRTFKFNVKKSQVYVEDKLDYLIENKMIKEESDNEKKENSECILCYGTFESYK